jgi:hypothetical protein
MESVNFNKRLKYQILKTIMANLKWNQRIPFLVRFVHQRYEIRNSDLFTGSDFIRENRERVKLEMDIVSTYVSLRKIVGDEKALATMVSLIQASASEAFLETMQLITKLGTMK